MSAFCIIHDENRCIQCRACEIHCQVWNGAPADVHPARLRMVEPQSRGNTANSPLVLRAAFVPCFHCDEPHCMRVCPTTAVRRRSRDGIVYIVAGLCTGCLACLMACPWRVPSWSASLERMFKCDLCRERLDAGLLPACVSGCTTGALRLSSDPQEVAAQRALHQASLHDGNDSDPEHGPEHSPEDATAQRHGQGGGAW